MWEAVAKLVEKYPNYTLGLIVAYVVLTVAVAVYQWVYSVYLEAKKDYHANLSLYCTEVSDIVAQIAVSEKYPKELIDKFWVYYYGKLVLVEDTELASKMFAMGSILETTIDQNYADRSKEELKRMRKAALDVSSACRDLMKKRWQLVFVPWVDIQKKSGKTTATGPRNPKEVMMELNEKANTVVKQ